MQEKDEHRCRPQLFQIIIMIISMIIILMLVSLLNYKPVNAGLSTTIKYIINALTL